MTDEVREQSPETVDRAEQLANALRLDVCGVDFLWNRVTRQFHFLEVNACPGFGPHLKLAFSARGEPAILNGAHRGVHRGLRHGLAAEAMAAHHSGFTSSPDSASRTT